ncbi:Disulfide bond formation protein B [Photobacterium damselae subsp. damselae]|uniref:disulfide bond formation protein DsbB n=1 Tax=Photobacterium damselae TaxID=38293 RepID=UPI00113BE2C9|nr:Disulfide bond formation protein B [Photobacterium damselae subsp. damselae]
MQLMQFFNVYSKSRKAWLTLLFCIIFFEGCALFFEHVMGLAPCVMCIYERVAMMGIVVAALIGLIAPQYPYFRWLGLAGWAYSAFRGFELAQEHVGYQFNPSPFATCDLFVKFPDWAPLNHWAPWMFEAYGDCSKVVWSFLGQSMPQWLVIIFAVNLLACAVMILAQFFNKKA